MLSAPHSSLVHNSNSLALIGSLSAVSFLLADIPVGKLLCFIVLLIT